MAQFHRPVVCVVGLDLAAQLFREHASDMVTPALGFNRAIPRGFLRYMNREDHGHYSAALRAALSAEVVSAGAAKARAIFAAALDRIATAPAGGTDPRPELRGATLAVLASMLCGIDPSSEAFAALVAAHDASDHRASGVRAHRAHLAYLTRIGALMRTAAVPADQPPAVLHELLRANPAALDDPTMVGNLGFMLKIGHDNLSGLCIWLIEMLGTHPEWMARIRASATSDAPLLACAAVLETLRLEQSEYLYRTARRSLRIGEFTEPKGSTIGI